MNKGEPTSGTGTLHQLNSGIGGGRILFHPILMHFAARYAGTTYGRFASDFRVLVNSNIRCMEDFALDAVGLISDPYRETSAFGAKIHFPEDSVPQCRQPIVRSLEDARLLKNPDIFKAERTRDRIEGAGEYRKRIGDRVPVIGWIEGPLAETCDLAGVSETMVNLMMEPELVRILIDKTTVTARDFARAQVEAGCGIIGMGDAICSQISSEQYREFVKEKHREIVDYIHSLGAAVKIHICGDITHLLPDLKDVGPDILDLDWMVDMENAFVVLGDGIIRCGNLDPVRVIEQQSKAELAGEVRELCRKEKGKRFILSGGCEITVNTPAENLSIMREVASEQR
jgi:MtaA/CmuA family methyltransferase